MSVTSKLNDQIVIYARPQARKVTGESKTFIVKPLVFDKIIGLICHGDYPNILKLLLISASWR